MVARMCGELCDLRGVDCVILVCWVHPSVHKSCRYICVLSSWHVTQRSLINSDERHEEKPVLQEDVQVTCHLPIPKFDIMFCRNGLNSSREYVVGSRFSLLLTV